RLTASQVRPQDSDPEGCKNEGSNRQASRMKTSDCRAENIRAKPNAESALLALHPSDSLTWPARRSASPNQERDEPAFRSPVRCSECLRPSLPEQQENHCFVFSFFHQ